MRNKILRSANAKYRYSYLFFYKINKGDLHVTYSFVCWCEIIDLVGFFGCYCLTPVTMKKVRKEEGTHSLTSYPTPLAVSPAHISLHHPHNLNAWNRLKREVVNVPN